MLGRFGRIALLVWSVWWFGYMSAAHQRGFVRIDDGSASCCAPAPRACCEESNPTPEPCGEHPDPRNPRNPRDRSDPVSHCAMCQLIARLDAPAPVDLSAPVIGLVARLDPPAPMSVASVASPVYCLGRAPPSFV